MLWITAIGMIVFPLVGFIFNSLITRKIDDGSNRQDEMEKKTEEDKELLLRRLDDHKKFCENNYVYQKMYDQAMQFHQKETDSKFNNLVESMNKQFENVEKNISGVKDLINEKFKKQG